MLSIAKILKIMFLFAISKLGCKMIPEAWNLNSIRSLYCDSSNADLSDELRHGIENINLGLIDEDRSRRSFLIYRALRFMTELQLEGKQSEIDRLIDAASERLNFSTRSTENRLYVPSVKSHKAILSNFGNAHIKGKVSDKRTSAILLLISTFGIPTDYVPEIDDGWINGFRFVRKST